MIRTASALCVLLLELGCACDSRPEPPGAGVAPPASEAGALMVAGDGAASPSVPWCRDRRPTDLARQAVVLLRGAADQGLLPSDYGAEALAASLQRLSASRAPAPEEAARFAAAIGAALERFLTDVHRGRVDARQAGFDYHPGERHRIADLVAGAAAGGDLADALAEAEPAYPQYRRLVVALRRHHGPEARRIALALERLRWLPHAPARRFLVANVPAFRLVAFDRAASDDPVLASAIVVGEAARERTPFFIDAVRAVIFRPFWYPPRGMIEREILPALQRDPAGLEQERMDLVARGADDAPALPATHENLARLAGGTLGLRQRPGPQNTLGLVKFMFPNRYDVYLHDTPARELFARPRRDFSHGCIRVEKAADLAAFLLAGMPEWTPEAIRAAMDGGRTFQVDLPEPVPIFIYYTTAIARRDGTVEFFDDIYGLDAALDVALGGAARNHATP